MDYFKFAADTAREQAPERYWVHFEQTDNTGYTTWDLDFGTLAEAEEMAEHYVDEREADRASITARHAPIDRQYSRSGWTIYE